MRQRKHVARGATTIAFCLGAGAVVTASGVQAQSADQEQIPVEAQADTVTENYSLLLRDLLREQGYSQVRFAELTGDILAARACSDGVAYDISFNRNGRVMEREETGACAAPDAVEPLSERAIVGSLYGKGYLRVDVVDRTPPTLLVNACRGERKFEVRLDAEGDIIDSKQDGACDLAEGDPLSAEDVAQILFLQGYRDVQFTRQDESSYTVLACNGVRRFEMTLSGAAKIRSRHAEGFCDAADEEVAYVPPRPVEEARLAGEDRLEPEECQMLLDWLQYDEPVTFSSESAALDAEDATVVAAMADAVARCPGARLLIEGHTSPTGDEAFNQSLSESRALAVRKALLEAGVAEDRIEARGFGEAYPRVIENVNSELNRRIEVNLVWTPA